MVKSKILCLSFFSRRQGYSEIFWYVSSASSVRIELEFLRNITFWALLALKSLTLCRTLEKSMKFRDTHLPSDWEIERNSLGTRSLPKLKRNTRFLYYEVCVLSKIVLNLSKTVQSGGAATSWMKPASHAEVQKFRYAESRSPETHRRPRSAAKFCNI